MRAVAGGAGGGDAATTGALPSAGRELDARIHALLTGGDAASNPPAYSTELAEAWRLLETLLGSRRWVEVVGTRDGEWICQIQDPLCADPEWLGTARGEAEAAPLAICRAALRVLESGF